MDYYLLLMRYIILQDITNALRFVCLVLYDDVMNIIIEEFPENASKTERRAVSDGVFAILREKGYVIR